MATLVLALGLGGCMSSRAVTPAVGRELPPTFLELAPGGVVDTSETKGEITIVAFFTTWCPASRETLTELASIAERSHAKVLAVDEGEKREDVVAFIRQYAPPVRIALDPDAVLARGLDLETVPSFAVIDRQGVIRHMHSGFHGAADREAIGREVRALVAEREGPLLSFSDGILEGRTVR